MAYMSCLGFFIFINDFCNFDPIIFFFLKSIKLKSPAFDEPNSSFSYLFVIFYYLIRLRNIEPVCYFVHQVINSSTFLDLEAFCPGIAPNTKVTCYDFHDFYIINLKFSDVIRIWFNELFEIDEVNN